MRGHVSHSGILVSLQVALQLEDFDHLGDSIGGDPCLLLLLLLLYVDIQADTVWARVVEMEVPELVSTLVKHNMRTSV